MKSTIAEAVYNFNALEYRENKTAKKMEKITALLLIESLHKRLAYLRGDKIITLSEYVKQNNKSGPALANAARRQKMPAFRERVVWRVSEGFVYEGAKK